MIRILLTLVLAIEIFALNNRGGGPLLSHLFLTGITFVIVCACFLFRGEFRFRFGFAPASYLAFFLFFTLSLGVSITAGYELAQLLLFADLGILLFIFAAAKIAERDLHWFAISLIALAVIDTLIGYFIYTQTPFPRFGGTFIDLREPHTSFGNDFANFLLLVLPLALWQFFREHSRPTTTWATGSAAAVLLSGFVLSFSRGAWLSFLTVGVITLIWWVIRRKEERLAFSKKNAIIRGASLIIVSILLINGLQWVRSQKFQTTPLFKKVTLQAHEGGASTSERIQFWKGAVQLMKERPLFGSGVLSFKYLYPKYQPAFGANWDHPHNIFLKFGVENGIFAMIFFAFFLIGVTLASLRFLWRKPWHPSVWFLLGSLGAFGHNLVDFNFIVSNFTLFMVFIALGLSFPNSKFQIPNSNLPLRSLFIISFFLLLLGLHEGFYNIDFKRGRAALAERKLDSAVTLLEKSKEMLFERDLVNYLAITYRQKFEETKNPIWNTKETDLLAEIALLTVDASLIARLGDLALEQKSLDVAETMFEKAVQMDPKNRLRYYYELARVKQLRGKPLGTAEREKILALLQEYEKVLRENRHFTILTDNPSFASKLYEFFGMKKEQAVFDNIWFRELLKFSTTYGDIRKPLL